MNKNVLLYIQHKYYHRGRKNIMIINKKKPNKKSLYILRYGLPLPSVVLIYAALTLAYTPPVRLLYIYDGCLETVAYALMSIAIVFAGAAAYEYLLKNSDSESCGKK